MTRRVILTFLSFAIAATAVAQQSRKLTADDYTEIQQLYARYNLAIDTGDARAWASTFTPDGVLGNASGHDALVQFANDFHKRTAGKTRHWNTNIVITPTEVGATGACYLLLFDTGVKPASPMTSGRYEDVLVKTYDGWKFESRTVRPDPTPKPAA